MSSTSSSQAGVRGTITLTSGELSITDDLSIQGPDPQKLKLSGNLTDRVFAVSSGVQTSISNLSIVDGRADGDALHIPGAGGGILNLGELSLQRVRMSRNQAVGDADRVVDVGPVFRTAGGAIGGAIANFGKLDVTHSDFFDNQALGADDVDFLPAHPTQFPFGTFPGNSFGGAISNFTSYYGTAQTTVVDSQFTGNDAIAGSRGVGDFAAIAGGGAIGNDSSLTIRGSSFQRNQAVGGDASVSPFHNGHALGGRSAPVR